ncbi:MAG: hypothetical protein V3S69_05380 [Dehalococcoidales bacterium]
MTITNKTYAEVSNDFFFDHMYEACAMRPSLKVNRIEGRPMPEDNKYYVRGDARAGFAISPTKQLHYQWTLNANDHKEMYEAALAFGATHGVLVES